MKILQVITLSELGGAQTVVANLSNKLSEEHDVIVASGEGDGKMWHILNDNIKKVQLNHLKRALSLKHDALALLELRKLYKKYKPDVIHLHSSKAGMLGRFIFPSKIIVYTVHGFDSIRIAYRKFLPLEKLMQHCCKAVIGVSKYDVTHMLDENIKKGVGYVYNGIYVPETFGELTFNLPQKYKKVVLCIARLSPPKNSDLFFETAKLLPEYAFVWIGNQHEVQKHPANVFFLGNVPNAGKYNAISDLFVLPSNYEGLPMVIIEAMSLGKPVVASNVGGISEIVRNGENGFVLENNAKLFAEKIQYILENNNIAEDYGKKSLEIFKSYLTVEHMTNAYLNIYKQLI